MVGAQHENQRAAMFVDEDCVDILLLTSSCQNPNYSQTPTTSHWLRAVEKVILAKDL